MMGWEIKNNIKKQYWQYYYFLIKHIVNIKGSYRSGLFLSP